MEKILLLNHLVSLAILDANDGSQKTTLHFVQSWVYIQIGGLIIFQNNFLHLRLWEGLIFSWGGGGGFLLEFYGTLPCCATRALFSLYRSDSPIISPWSTNLSINYDNG